MQLSKSNGIAYILSALVVTLLGGFIAQFYPNAQDIAWISEAIELPAHRETVPFTHRSPAPYKLIAQRPLFTESRQPWKETLQQEKLSPNGPPKRDSFRKSVAGTITTPNQKIAFVVDDESGNVAVLKEGEIVDSRNMQWLVERVDQATVSFTTNGIDSTSTVTVEVGRPTNCCG